MSDSLLVVAVGIGILINMITFEIFGLCLGGMVVPGYIALNFSHPSYVISTYSVAFLVFLLVRLLSMVVLVFGRRHLMVAILLGFLLGRVLEYQSFLTSTPYSVEVIGYILPGLIAYWMERQGVLRTLTVSLMGAIITHLLIILVTSGKVLI